MPFKPIRLKTMFFAVVLSAKLMLAGSGAEPSLSPNPGLQQSLQKAVEALNLTGPLGQHRLAISLVDLTDAQNPRYAGLNDHEMMYAASLPKICVLVAAFERILNGQLVYTSALKEMFTRMIRFSSNVDASCAIQTVGFDYIAKVLEIGRAHV